MGTLFNKRMASNKCGSLICAAPSTLSSEKPLSSNKHLPVLSAAPLNTAGSAY